jgi:hypothetical protein
MFPAPTHSYTRHATEKHRPVSGNDFSRAIISATPNLVILSEAQSAQSKDLLFLFSGRIMFPAPKHSHTRHATEKHRSVSGNDFSRAIISASPNLVILSGARSAQSKDLLFPPNMHRRTSGRELH